MANPRIAAMLLERQTEPTSPAPDHAGKLASASVVDNPVLDTSSQGNAAAAVQVPGGLGSSNSRDGDLHPGTVSRDSSRDEATTAGSLVGAGARVPESVVSTRLKSTAAAGSAPDRESGRASFSAAAAGGADVRPPSFADHLVGFLEAKQRHAASPLHAAGIGQMMMGNASWLEEVTRVFVNANTERLEWCSAEDNRSHSIRLRAAAATDPSTPKR